MDKPITVVYEDFKQELANLINNSNLPAFIIEPILKDYLIEIRSIIERQYQIDKTQYEQAMIMTENEN